MKIYNLGNDYAYQKKQKASDNHPVKKQIEQPIINEIENEKNVGDKIQRGGQGDMAEPASKTKTDLTPDHFAPKKKEKKKKETGAENMQSKE